jgi:hypothetical protein
MIRDQQILGPYWALSSVALPVKRRAKKTADAGRMQVNLSEIAFLARSLITQSSCRIQKSHH